MDANIYLSAKSSKICLWWKDAWITEQRNKGSLIKIGIGLLAVIVIVTMVYTYLGIRRANLAEKPSRYFYLDVFLNHKLN